ncbi:MAG TPA: hypothetical protein VED40_05855 [Azospirillaceae bacterium]|nr:hypothetical protein [Azospirillaceae bacterium]
MPLLPGASRIEAGPLASLLFMPLLAGVTVAACLFWADPLAAAEMVGGGAAMGWTVLAGSTVKLCYLGTAAAHVGHLVSERLGGIAAVFGIRQDEEEAPAPALSDPGFWARFPNEVDATLLAIALTTLAHRLAM